MDTRNYQIGIEINTNHINAVLVFQQNKQWEIKTFWQFPLISNTNIDNTNLRNILKQWCKGLPPLTQVAISLPDPHESYHTTPLPTSITLSPATLHRLAQLRATTYEQKTNTSMTIDYRQNNQNLAVHLYNKKIIDSFVALFSTLNIAISAIDIPACALRYLATYLTISPENSLIYCQQQTLFWVGADKDMPLYGSFYYDDRQGQENHFQQLITKYRWPLAQCYFAGENASYFSHLMPIWPDITHALFKQQLPDETLSLIALGLALRPKGLLCIK